MDSISAASIRLIAAAQLGPAGLAKTAWAVAKLLWRDPPLLASISAASIRRMGDFLPQGLSNIAWAFSTLLEVDEPILTAIASASRAKLCEFTSQALANTAWAVARLLFDDGTLMTSISSQALARLSEFASKELASTAWSIATLGVTSEGPLLDAIASAALNKMPNFDPQSLVNTAWAFSSLSFVHQPLMEAISSSARRKIAEFLPTDITCLVDAFAATGQLDPLLFRAASAAVQQCADAGDGGDGDSPTAAAWGGEDDFFASATPCIITERPQVCVLWKPPRWAAVVKFGESGASEQVAEECEAGDGARGTQALERWIVQHMGRSHAIANDAAAQHGLVHRLDRDTSGVLLWAKSYAGLHAAHLQFAARRVLKEYLCLAHGSVHAAPRMLLAPLRTFVEGGSARSAVDACGGRRAATELRAVTHLRGPGAAQLSLVEVRIHTGRTHQIRVHLSAEGHPLVGDGLYGRGRSRMEEPALLARTFLHARRLRLEVLGGLLEASAPLAADLQLAVRTVGVLDGRSRLALRELC